MTAIAIDVQGRPGTHRAPEDQLSRATIAKERALGFCRRIDGMESDQIAKFLDFDTLNELITTVPSGLSVGDFEREFFVKAFQVLIEEKFALDSMTACWRAY